MHNTATGYQALYHNTTINGISPGANTATGYRALHNNTTGSSNTATGSDSLHSNATGGGNTANGVSALTGNTTGNSNTASGYLALGANTTGSGNIALGQQAGVNVTTANNVICIGTTGANVSNSCYIGQIFGATSSNGVAVFVNANGRLGTMTSSARFKDEIKPMDIASESLFALKPVAFQVQERY